MEVGHYHHQPSGAAYNGAKPSAQDLEQSFGNEDKDEKFPTLDRAFNWVNINRY
jgi:hypothetical protein